MIGMLGLVCFSHSTAKHRRKILGIVPLPGLNKAQGTECISTPAPIYPPPPEASALASFPTFMITNGGFQYRCKRYGLYRHHWPAYSRHQLPHQPLSRYKRCPRGCRSVTRRTRNSSRNPAGNPRYAMLGRFQVKLGHRKFESSTRAMFLQHRRLSRIGAGV